MTAAWHHGRHAERHASGEQRHVQIEKRHASVMGMSHFGVTTEKGGATSLDDPSSAQKHASILADLERVAIIRRRQQVAWSCVPCPPVRATALVLARRPPQWRHRYTPCRCICSVASRSMFAGAPSTPTPGRERQRGSFSSAY